MIQQLKALRKHCADTIARIDAILPQVEDFAGTPTLRREMLVEGRCTHVTQHAIDRFRERSGSNKGDQTIINRMTTRLQDAEEMELKERYRINELLAHGTPARYFKHADIIFVIEGGAVVTAHNGQADRWIPKPTLATAESSTI